MIRSKFKVWEVSYQLSGTRERSCRAVYRVHATTRAEATRAVAAWTRHRHAGQRTYVRRLPDNTPIPMFAPDVF